MAKKLFTQLALAIMISLIMMPIALAGPAGNLNQLGNPWNIQQNGKGDINPCIVELKPKNESNPDYKDLVPGPDNGYVINVIEEPLNVQETKEKTTDNPQPNYVIRRCFRNTFQYTESVIKAGKIIKYIPHTVTMLADKCSQTAQNLMTDDKKNGLMNNAGKIEGLYQVKYSCKEVQVILTKGGSSAIYGYINMIYRWGASLVGIIAVTVITVSGIQISASGGDSEAISSAKKRIIQSIVGLLVLFLSSLILYTINPTFFTM
jgi:hypothetical protein